MSAPRYDMVLMDADNTLFDFCAAEAQAFSRTMERYSLPRANGDYAGYSAVNESLWKAFERGEITQPRLRVERFERFFAWIGYRVDCESFNRDYLLALGDGHKLLPGAKELCAALHGLCRLYIATNGISVAQRKRFAASGIAEYFEDIFISEELNAHKPEPAYFDAVFARLGATDRSHAIILGDSLTSDIQGGRNAGITTCWLNTAGAECPKPELCDHIITRLVDFPVVLGLEGLASSPGLY